MQFDPSLCRTCRHCRPGTYVDPAEGIRGMVSAELKIKWLEEAKERQAREYDYVRNGGVFVQFPPEFYDWCALHSDLDARHFKACKNVHTRVAPCRSFEKRR